MWSFKVKFGAFIIEYAGELITVNEFYRREETAVFFDIPFHITASSK